jgi:hypothetical protein
MIRLPYGRLAASTLVLFAAACSDSSGPGQLTDPLAVSAELQSLDSAFASPVFQSYSAVSARIGPTAAGLSTAGLLVQSTLPAAPRSHASAYLRTARRAQLLRQLVPHGAQLVATGIFPDTLKGKTFDYDTASNNYVLTARAGADTAGIRFILYVVNPVTELPVEPLVEVGFVDLIDKSTPASARLQILVEGVGGTPTYVDYLAAVTPGLTSLRASVTGSISNGLSAGANKTLGFSVTIVATLGAVTETASFSLNNPSLSVSITVVATDTNTSFEIAVDFRFTRTGETIQLAGTLTFTEVAPDSFDLTHVDAAVRVNGATFATISGDPNTTRWVKADGTPLTLEELDALDHLGETVEHFIDLAEDLFDPIENVFG